MKIAFTGGGTGGHFYPIIAIAEQLTKLIEQEGYLNIELYYISNKPYNQELLDKYNLKFVKLSTGKNRIYFSVKNFFDYFKIVGGIVRAFSLLFKMFPDVIVSKGGYPSFPVTFVARFLGIPVIIHESDTVPGRANIFAAKFAEKIAVSYAEAAAAFPKEKVALTGNPVRSEVLNPIRDGSHDALNLDSNRPTILVLGGSQGAEIINDIMLRSASALLDTFQIVHQVGPKNYDSLQGPLSIAIENHPNKAGYKAMSYMDSEQVRQAAGVADLVISRAGSTLFEIAAWALPSIIIPITESNGDHQRKNAYAYARQGGCIVIEEVNLSPSIFVAEIERVHTDQELRQRMITAAQSFGNDRAALVIAEQVMSVLKRHK